MTKIASIVCIQRCAVWVQIPYPNDKNPIADVRGEFEKLRHSLAHSFPFELDDFQKAAIVLLEQVCSCLHRRTRGSSVCKDVPTFFCISVSACEMFIWACCHMHIW